MTDGVRRVFWDTETTGFSPEAGHRIVEIALVEADDDLRKTGRHLHRYVNPQGQPVGETLGVHGLSDEFLAGHEPFSAIVDDVLAFAEGAVLVAHNTEFDVKFLNAELARLGRVGNWASTEDTLQMARRKYPGEPASLDSLIRRFGIDARKRVKHGALIDTELLIEVYAHLVGLTSLLPEQAVAVASSEGVAVLMPEWARQSFPERERQQANEAEFDRHVALVMSLKSPLWTSVWDSIV